MSYDLNVSYIALEQLDRPLAHSEANEAFGFVIRILDIFTRIVNNFKTSIRGFTKQFKRSELVMYHQSHKLALQEFFKTRRFNLDLSVPIPSGMKVTYLEAATALDKLHEQLDIETTIATLQTYFNAVKAAGQVLPPEAITEKISRVTKKSVELDLRKIFVKNKTLEVPLRTVIPSFDELIKVDQLILKYEKIFQSVDQISKSLDRIERIIDELITAFEKQPNSVDRKQIQALYKLIMTASVQLDMFGVVIAEQQRLEHNFVIMLKTLVEKTK